MDKPSITFTLTMSDFIAIWGGITGTIGLFIAYLNFRRDKADIKLTLKKGYNIINSPQHDPKATYTVLTVSNKGRRTVTINSAGYVLLKKQGGAIFSDSMIYGQRELPEGKSVDFTVKEDLNDKDEISYYAAYDAVGNTHKLYVSPFYKRFIYWFLDFTRIKKKKPLVVNKKKATNHD